ncbi:hypothetical protein LPTSP2_04520 [Leptospira ellinghausenii]|uniref:Uncharacterized protein n=1 Tax=Leptospira ellinghausenii TaxID=1917822 RepID=A0A2P2D974_9LEPT|nr:hypothetical protein LPTSP2_04520 [Leptospira ellinghausenii]
MNYFNSRKKEIEFQKLNRNKLQKEFFPLGYNIIYDNSKYNKSNTNRWIFKITFKGNTTVEIFNENWRDYT